MKLLRCRVCEREMPEDKFPPRKWTYSKHFAKDLTVRSYKTPCRRGHDHWCRECKNAYVRRRRAERAQPKAPRWGWRRYGKSIEPKFHDSVRYRAAGRWWFGVVVTTHEVNGKPIKDAAGGRFVTVRLTDEPAAWASVPVCKLWVYRVADRRGAANVDHARAVFLKNRATSSASPAAPTEHP